MIKCEICSKYFITKESLEFINNKTGTEDEFEICDSCKKKIISDKFKELFKILI